MTGRRAVLHRLTAAIGAVLCVALWFGGDALASSSSTCAPKADVDTQPDQPSRSTGTVGDTNTAAAPSASSATCGPVTMSTKAAPATSTTTATATGGTSTAPASADESSPTVDQATITESSYRVSSSSADSTLSVESYSALAAPAPATDPYTAVVRQESTQLASPSPYDSDIAKQIPQPITVEVSNSGSGTTVPPPTAPPAPPATDVPPSGESGVDQTIPTGVTFTSEGVGPDDELPITGPGLTLRLILTGLVLLDLGWLMASAYKAPRSGQVTFA